jgi:hypothetical protein
LTRAATAAPHAQVGFAAAYYDTGAFVASALGAYTACACLVIAWLNLSNDAWVRVWRLFGARAH